MRTETWAGLRVRLVGGSDREGGGTGPVVVLLHGFGAGGDDLVPLWRVLRVPRDTRFVFPEAPLGLAEYGDAARAWWHIDIAALQAGARRDRTRDEPPGLAPAHAVVVALLNEVQKQLSVPLERIILGGFSQGAMLSCDVALRSAPGLAGLVLLSGTLIAANAWEPQMAACQLPIFQSHGRQDPVLPFGGATALRDRLQQAGCDLHWVEFNGGHEIPEVVLEQLGGFLTKTLSRNDA